MNEEIRELSMSESDNLIFLFYRSDYKSYFPMMSFQSGEFNGYIGSLCSTGGEDSFDQLDDFSADRDLYICSNGMTTMFKHSFNYLINIQNLVIDIDCHKTDIDLDILNERIKIVEKELVDNLIVKPNLINRTGRGMHLWYCIQPCHVSLKFACLNAIELICNDVQKILESLEENDLELDRPSSIRLNGIFRIPYTYNTKAKRWSESTMYHNDEPHINEILKTYKTMGFLPKKIEREKRKKKRGVFRYNPTLRKNPYFPCLVHRKQFIDYVFSIKEIGVGIRNYMFFATYSTLVRLYDVCDARDYCCNLNDNIATPLLYCELSAIFRYVEKTKPILKTETFLTYMQATESEKKRFYRVSVKEERRLAKKHAKEEKYNKVKELHANGMTIASISRELGISRPTIYKIIG